MTVCPADAQADLSLCWAHSHFVGFVMLRLILYFPNDFKFLDRQVFSDSVDSDQTEESDKDLHCLLSAFLDIHVVLFIKTTMFKF